MSLSVNDRAPDFELLGHDEEKYRIRDYRGVPVVLVFFPFAFSGVCSEEHACLVDEMSRFNRLDCQVFGISVDHKFALAAFAAKLGIEYPLLADFHPKGQVGKRYGVYDEEGGFERRWTFVIDPEGRVSFIQKNEVGEVPEIDEVIEAVEQAL